VYGTDNKAEVVFCPEDELKVGIVFPSSELSIESSRESSFTASELSV
jgi:hypothetical protein